MESLEETSGSSSGSEWTSVNVISKSSEWLSRSSSLDHFRASGGVESSCHHCRQRGAYSLWKPLPDMKGFKCSSAWVLHFCYVNLVLYSSYIFSSTVHIWVISRCPSRLGCTARGDYFINIWHAESIASIIIPLCITYRTHSKNECGIILLVHVSLAPLCELLTCGENYATWHPPM
jgi:hypothetical protein